MRPTALAAGPLVPTVDSQRPLAPCHDASTGTKLSRHAPPAGDTGTKLSQHATLAAPTGTKLSRHAPPAAHPVQNSPSTPETPLFGAFCASRENFVPLPPPPSRAGRIFYRIRNHLRYKTLPARAPVGPPGTKLSQHATLAAPTGTKLSRHAPPAAHPVQNSPSTPETPLFGAFCASRENFVPLPPPPSRAGRKKSRTGRAKRGGASPYSPRNALIAGISRTAWTRPAR